VTAAPPAAPRTPTVPVWLDRLASVGWRVLVTAGLGLVLIALTIVLSTVTASVLLALVVAAPLAPTVRGLRARGLSRAIASAVACGVGLAVFALALILLIVSVVPYLRQIVAAVSAGISDVADGLVAIGAPDAVIAGFDRFVDGLRGLLAVNVAAFAGTAVTVGTILVLAAFLLYFVLQDGDRGWSWLMGQLKPEHAATLTEGATIGVDHVGGYVRRVVIMAAADALAAAVLLAVLGSNDLGPLLGPLVALVFVAGLVPYLGAIVTTAAIALILLAVSGPLQAVLFIVGVAAAAIAEDRLLADTSIGRRVDVHPAIVVIAITAGAALYGILGLITALPVTVFVLAVTGSVIAVLDERVADVPRVRAEPGAWSMPGWLDRLAQWSWRGLVTIALGLLVIRIIVSVPIVAVPVVLAIVTAATLLPLMRRLRARGWSMGAAAAATTIGATVAVAAAVIVTVIWMVQPLGDILSTALDGAGDLDLGWLVSAVNEVGAVISIDIAGILTGILGVVLVIVLTLLLTFLFLRDGGKFWNLVIDRLRGARREHLDDAGDRAVDVLSGYMIGTAVISLFGAVTSALIMIILGLPLAIPIGVLTFFGGFIPYIGSFVTTALAFLVAVAVGTTADIVIMFVYTIVFNLIQGSVVAPIVYSKALSLHPAIVLLAVPIGGAIAGILGMFLVVPIAAIVSATWRLVVATIEDDTPETPIAADEASAAGADPARAAPPGSPGGTAPASAGT
jgi:predicted PurR-regulated permease PerM